MEGSATGLPQLEVAYGEQGEIVFAGTFDGALKVGNVTLSSVGQDIFVVRFSANGNVLGYKRYGDASPQRLSAIALDADGNVVLGGNFSGTLDFGLGCSDLSGGDMFLAKFNSAGTCLWAKAFQVSGTLPEGYLTDLTLDDSGSVFAVGWFNGTTTFGGPMLSATGTHAFAAKLSSAGAHLWSTQSTGTGVAAATAVAWRGPNSLVVAGHYFDSAGFGGTVLSGGSHSLFVAAYQSADAGHVWSKGFPGNGGAEAIALDSQLNATVVGWYLDSLDLDGNVLDGVDAYDGFVVQLGPTGGHRWSHGVAGLGIDTLYGVAIDGSDNVVTAAKFSTRRILRALLIEPRTPTSSSASSIAPETTYGAIRTALRVPMARTTSLRAAPERARSSEWAALSTSAEARSKPGSS